MTHLPRHRSLPALTLSVAVVLAAAVLALLVLARSAHAEELKGFGEIARFGEPGDGPGQLDELRTRGLGVDPTDNSVYVVDEPSPPTEVPAEEKVERHLRIQKFTLVAGKYTLRAAAAFVESSPAFEGFLNEPPVDGLAVDPKDKRVYLLAMDIRNQTLKQDATESKGSGELFAASTLYAFSTVDSGGKLPPAGSEGPSKEILIGPGTFNAQSETPEAALLAPRGITVDPSTDEIIVLGHVDPNKVKVDELSKDHYVLRRFSAAGALVSTYVDKTDVLRKELGLAFKPTSPVVVESGGTEHLDVAYGGLVEIPTSGSPKRLLLTPEGAVAGGPTDAAGRGGRLAASPDGAIWAATGEIKNEGTPEPYAGVIAYSGADGSEIGWTGGQIPTEPAKTSDRCVLEPYNYGLPSLLQHVGAGSGGDVFALVPEFLLRLTPEGIEEEEGKEEERMPLPGPFFASIVELGPGGSGCPEASPGAIVAKLGAIEVKGEEVIAPGKVVTLTSHVKQADALKVEWEFGDGSENQTIKTTKQFQDPKVEHKFDKEGAFTVTEKIYSDDLAASTQTVYSGGHLTTPTFVLHRKLLVSKPLPTGTFRSKASYLVGESATFEAEGSDPNEKAAPLEYSWNFGDGSAETSRSTSTTASHAYTTAGTFTVILTITDQLGLKSLPITNSITVTSPETGGGGGGGGGGTGGGETVPPPPGGGGGGGSGGVLSYRAGLARTALSVKPNGAFSLTVECLGQASCTGAVTLKTLTAVSARAHKQILTLGSASFALAAGGSKTLTIRLSSKARRLLARVHVLRARATIVAHDAQGKVHTEQFTVVLRLAKGHH